MQSAGKIKVLFILGFGPIVRDSEWIVRAKRLKGYISRVTRPLITSAAAHTKLRLSQALLRTARPTLL